MPVKINNIIVRGFFLFTINTFSVLCNNTVRKQEAKTKVMEE